MALKSLTRWQGSGLAGALILSLLTVENAQPARDFDDDATATAVQIAVQKAREVAAQSQSQKNLRNIVIAMHNFHDVTGRFPSQAAYDKNGKAMLSWRVLLLPFLEQLELYNQFHFYEPWDSEHNKKLLPRMPKLYAAPQDDKAIAEHKTYYLGFAGRGTFFNGKTGIRFQDAIDGTSQTIMLIEARTAVPWTKPEDIAYDPAKPLPKFGLPGASGFSAAMIDGSVHWLSPNITEETLRNAITWDDGNVLGAADFK